MSMIASEIHDILSGVPEMVFGGGKSSTLKPGFPLQSLAAIFSILRRNGKFSQAFEGCPLYEL